MSLLGVLLLGATCTGESGDVFGSANDQIEGSGQVISKSRSIEDFNAIVLAGEGRVLFAEGTDGRIEIQTDDNLLDRIETKVSGSTLTISTQSGIDIDPTDGVVYRLGCPELTGVVLSGAGLIDLAQCATANELKLEMAGAGTISAPSLATSALDVSLPGAGRIVVSGRTDRLEVVLAGAGSFDGADLVATVAIVDSAGVGVVTVWATDTLDLSLAGVGTIRYYGEPTVTQSVPGVGSIEALGSR